MTTEEKIEAYREWINQFPIDLANAGKRFNELFPKPKRRAWCFFVTWVANGESLLCVDDSRENAVRWSENFLRNELFSNVGEVFEVVEP